MNNKMENILYSVNNVINLDDFGDERLISVYDVFETIKSYNLVNRETSIINEYSSFYEQILSDNYKSTKARIIGFNNDTKLLEIDFDIDYTNHTELKPIHFIKEDGKLFVYKDKTNKQSKILEYLEDSISWVYDALEDISEKMNCICHDIETTSTVFTTTISYDEIVVYYKNISDLCYSLSVNDGTISVKSSNPKVIKTLNGSKEEFLKHLLVNINDCPSWLHASLNELRHNQLTEPEKPKKAEKSKIMSILNKRLW